MNRKFLVSNEIDLFHMSSSQLDSFFVGLVLGDGCIRKNGDFNFSSTNKNLVDLIEEIIKSSTNFKITRQFFKGKFRRGYQERDMYTLDIYSQKKYFLKIREYMYNENGRCITDKLLSKLHLHSLAFWYISDGSLSLMGRGRGKIEKRVISLATHAFTHGENKMIEYWFRNYLGIEVNTRPQGKYYYIKMPIKESQKLFTLIFPYIITDFYYKIDLAYDDKKIDYKLIEGYKEIYNTIKEHRSQEVWEMI